MIAMIGVGTMGEMILTGLIKAGWAPSDVIAVHRRTERREEIATQYGVAVSDDIPQASAVADVVVVAVKPYDAAAVWPQIGETIRPGAVVVSLCAGLTTAQIEAALPVGTPVVRAMPNTPAQVGAGMTVISGGQAAAPADVDRVVDIMNAVGKTVVVAEKYQDAAASVSGCGPAYVFLIAEAMTDAGVMLGLPRAIASELVAQMLYGSGKLLSESGTHPTVLRERVTSPGGTTAAATRVLEEYRVRAAFAQAMEASCAKSAELAS